jgi:hypothetical protein
VSQIEPEAVPEAAAHTRLRGEVKDDVDAVEQPFEVGSREIELGEAKMSLSRHAGHVVFLADTVVVGGERIDAVDGPAGRGERLGEV